MRFACARPPGGAAAQAGVVTFDDLLAVHKADQALRLDAHAQSVPLPGFVGIAGDIGKDGPGINIGTIEAGEAQLAAGGVEAVVFLRAI